MLLLSAPRLEELFRAISASLSQSAFPQQFAMSLCSVLVISWSFYKCRMIAWRQIQGNRKKEEKAEIICSSWKKSLVQRNLVRCFAFNRFFFSLPLSASTPLFSLSLLPILLPFSFFPSFFPFFLSLSPLSFLPSSVLFFKDFYFFYFYFLIYNVL